MVDIIVNNESLVRMFGTKEQNDAFDKNRKVQLSLKNSLLSKARNEFKIVEDIGRGKYKLDEKFDGSIIVPNNKMAHPIYGNLIPSIMINVKNYHDDGKVFCLSLNGIYSSFNMIHETNYSKMSDRRNISSKILKVDCDTLNEFFDVTHGSLRYYLDNSIDLLVALKLIKCNKIPYVSILVKESEHGIIDVESSFRRIRRRSTKEEEQFIEDCEREIRNKYSIDEGKLLFGKPKLELDNMLKTKNIEYSFKCYELICLDKDNIDCIVEFYGVNNLENLSKSFSENFISMTIANAENRHSDAIVNNIIDFHRFSEKYLDDFMKLANTTLDYTHADIFVPEYTVTHYEDGYGGCKTITKKCK